MSQKFKATIFFFWCALSNFSAYSQDSIACLYNKRWEETTIRDSAAYFRTGEKLRSGKWDGPIRDYYISGKIQMAVRYVDDKKQGMAYYYYTNGQLSSTGNYLNNENTGPWKYFYENGTIKSEGSYEKGKETGIWKYYYENNTPRSEGEYTAGIHIGIWKYYYQNGALKSERKYLPAKNEKDQGEELLITYADSLGNVMIKNGEGKYSYYNPKDTSFEEGNYLAGLQTGTWKGTSPEVTYEEIYDQGKLVKGKSIGKDGIPHEYNTLQSTAEYPGGIKEMMLFLQKNIKYPKDAEEKDIQGKVYVEFVIDTKGRVTNVKIKRGVWPSLDREATRVVELFPDWVPAFNRGIRVKQRYVLPLNFKINNKK